MRRKCGAPCLPVQTAAQPPEPARRGRFTGALPQKSLSNMFDKPTKFKKQIFSLCTHWGTDLKKILNSHLPRDKCTSLWYNICELIAASWQLANVHATRHARLCMGRTAAHQSIMLWKLSIIFPTARSARPALLFIARLLFADFGISTAAQVAPTASPVVIPFINEFMITPRFCFIFAISMPKMM